MRTISVQESGHIKNASNFSELIVEVQSFPAYNPFAVDLKIVNLQVKDAIVQTAINNVNIKEGLWKAKINNRQTSYEKMLTLSSRSVGVVASLDLNAKIVKDLRSIMKDIRGTRATKLPPEPEPNAMMIIKKTISVAQTSFDKRKDNFSKLVGLLQTVSGYAPNEADLTILNLNTYISSLQTVNKDVANAATELFKARKQRNIELYAERTGLVDIALRVKEYVKSMLPAGASSAEYKRIKHIKFKDLLLSEKESLS